MASISLPGIERRACPRLQLELVLFYKAFSKNTLLRAGTGRTCNISRLGVLFEADSPLSVGAGIELSIAWPVLHDGTEPIELLIYGRVVRTEDSKAALQVVQYDFRIHSPETGDAPVQRQRLRKWPRNPRQT